MKRFSVFIFILLAAVVLVQTGCPVEPPDYRIEFTVDGTSHVFRESHFADVAVPAAAVLTSGLKTLFVANSETDGEYVYFEPPGTATGTFTDTLNSMVFEYVRPGLDNIFDYDQSAGDFTFTITKYGSVGGDIEGTFSGIAGGIDGTAGVIVSDGYFLVLREADGSLGME